MKVTSGQHSWEEKILQRLAKMQPALVTPPPTDAVKFYSDGSCDFFSSYNDPDVWLLPRR